MSKNTNRPNQASGWVNSEEQAATIVDILCQRGVRAWRRGRTVFAQSETESWRRLWLMIGDCMGRVDESGEVRS